MKSDRSKNASLTQRFFFLIILLVATATVGNTQTDADNSRFFVNGSIALLNYGGTSSSLNGFSTDVPSAFVFKFVTEVGYRLNDVFSVGPLISIETVHSKEKKPDPVDPAQLIEFASKDLTWMFDVFGRYELMRRGKFSLHIHTQMGIDRGSTKEKTGSVEKKTKSMKMIGFTIVPLVAYDFSAKFSFITKVDFLSFGGSIRTVKFENTGDTIKTHYLAFNSLSRVFYLADVNIGFIYKF